MKRRQKIFFGAAFSLLLMSCGGIENGADEYTDTENYEEHSSAPQTIKYEIEISDPQAAEEKTTAETSIPTMATEDVNVIPPNVVPEGPFAPADNFLDGAHEVDPWLANYVGSYGLLPTRFAKEGPALYSLDVHPRSSRHLAKNTDD